MFIFEIFFTDFAVAGCTVLHKFCNLISYLKKQPLFFSTSLYWSWGIVPLTTNIRSVTLLLMKDQIALVGWFSLYDTIWMIFPTGHNLKWAFSSKKRRKGFALWHLELSFNKKLHNSYLFWVKWRYTLPHNKIRKGF